MKSAGIANRSEPEESQNARNLSTPAESPKQLRIIYNNIHSFSKYKVEELKKINEEHVEKRADKINEEHVEKRADVILIAESWHAEEVLKSYELSDYTLVTCYKRPVKKGGGVSIFAKKSLEAARIDVDRHNLQSIFEVCAMEINDNVEVIALYYTGKNLHKFKKKLHSFLNHLDSRTDRLRIIGVDINVDSTGDMLQATSQEGWWR
ncbi:hypothetical protein QE152_g28546 [Popillia japonica]|uniref:Endonuclease/exonuclease/phosphatase domain-containing protein n=1 Tax=Popillia japonica TaxID=7064 RepID=A0AAW1JJL7_POPJA